MTDTSLRVLLPAEKIRARVRELGREIDRDYPDGVYLIAILKGAFVFLADLARAISRPARLDFIGISSYGGGKTSSGEVKLTKDVDTSIEGADVLIVEDIVDSGITLSYLSTCSSRGARVRCASRPCSTSRSAACARWTWPTWVSGFPTNS